MLSKGLRVIAVAGWIGLSVGLGAGCAPRPTDRPPPAVDTREARHPLVGRVVSVLAERGTLLVDHDEIPGYMPRMTMEFAVNRGDLARAREGATLRAELVDGGEGDFRLEKVWWVDAGAEARVAAATGALRQDTQTRGKGAYREVGENVPDFTLYDQAGQVVSATRFRGQQVMLNFIFTRCPVPEMCPAATLKMTQTQAAALAAGVRDIQFVSITLDPEYDTPGILKTYAEERGIDTTNFTFLTGPEGAIKDLLRQFGVLSEPEANGSILKHTLATVLVDARGRIVWRADGSGWKPADFVLRMVPPPAGAAPATVP
jgi:protein SCO1